jgi:hypothetical protein
MLAGRVLAQHMLRHHAAAADNLAAVVVDMLAVVVDMPVAVDTSKQ